MVSADCYEPHSVCEFAGGGRPGSCSDTTGILTYAEISARNKMLDVETFYDYEITVKYNIYEGDQWISYDDEQSLFDKKKFLTNYSEGWYCHISVLPKRCRKTANGMVRLFGAHSGAKANAERSCFTGHRNLCCDSAAVIDGCYWTECQGLLTYTELPTCPTGFTYMTYWLDNPDGKPWCADGWGYTPHYTVKSVLCCPEQQAPRSCSWTNNNFEVSEEDPFNAWDLVCKPSQCPKGTVKFANTLYPATSKAELGSSGISCDDITLPQNMDAEFSFCCDPPSRYNEEWPVDPKYLWEHYYNDPQESDVVWEYSNEYEKNNRDYKQAESGAEDGSDAYGFVMLDGPEGSINNSFVDTQTVVCRSATIPKVKRLVLTTNQTLLDLVFDHHEEAIYIYCNYPAGSRECDQIFINGAEDTIIHLPHHVGEGLFARIVSMQLAYDKYQLPDHHVEHRRSKRNNNLVYEVKINYNFHKIIPKRADELVNIWVDYTNLLGYWDEMTNSPASRMKRGIGEDGLTHAK
ncbi:hypothetical protein BDV12DRAFT_204280 [Aspergillus spectabilis]